MPTLTLARCSPSVGGGGNTHTESMCVSERGEVGTESIANRKFFGAHVEVATQQRLSNPNAQEGSKKGYGIRGDGNGHLTCATSSPVSARFGSVPISKPVSVAVRNCWSRVRVRPMRCERRSSSSRVTPRKVQASENVAVLQTGYAEWCVSGKTGDRAHSGTIAATMRGKAPCSESRQTHCTLACRGSFFTTCGSSSRFL